MPSLHVLATGRLDERDSAFPQSVQLPDGDILCSFGVGGGQFVHGGTDWVRSKDQGRTWRLEGTILPPTENPPSANFLKLSLSADGRTIYAYGTRFWGAHDGGFGDRKGETVSCTSTDGGHRWSPPETVPTPDFPIEVSHSLRPLSSGRLLAPYAVLKAKERLGDEVRVVISDDGGRTWPREALVFKDPAGQLGFWEQKFVEVAPNRVMAVAWTVTLGDYHDQPNSFALSDDGGVTWGPHRSTGIRGQTMTPLPLGGDRLLVLYNRRYGAQGVVGVLATFTDDAWTVHHESLVYDAKALKHGPDLGNTGVDELASFQFGFPTAIRLTDGTYLATHWCVEQGISGIRWTKLKVEW